MNRFNINDFKGVIPAVVTVFDKDENIDEIGMRQLISFLIDQGVNGLYLTGSTGEGFTMVPEERKRVVEIVIDETAGRVPVVVHVGAIGTKISIDLAKHAERAGADGISSVPPFYWKFNENQIVNYYKDIADSCNLPMIVYNITLAGLMNMNTIKRLSKIESIKGIKYTALSHYEIMEIKDEIANDFLVYSGADEMAMSGLLAGADGIIGSFYNIMPRHFINLYNAIKSNDIDKARKLQKQAVEVIMYTLKMPSFYAGMKVILKWMGINGGYCRRPFENLTEEQEAEFRRGFRELKKIYDLEGIDFIDAV